MVLVRCVGTIFLGKDAEMDFEEDQLIQDSRFSNQE